MCTLKATRRLKNSKGLTALQDNHNTRSRNNEKITRSGTDSAVAGLLFLE